MKQSQAVVQKRHQTILDLIEKKQNIQVSETSKALGVSELTIRRDFDLLASKGYLIRYHGGARQLESTLHTAPFFNKNSMNRVQKEQIAKVAASFIFDGDTVTLNAGTTTLEVFKAAMDKKATIVTNNATACVLLEEANLSLVCTGGEYNAKNNSYAGPLSTALISKMFSNICILGVNGITAEEGVTTAFYPETMINQMFLKQNRGLKIVVADGSKLGRTFCFNSATIDAFDILITDSSANPEELKKLEDLPNLKVILADQVNFDTFDASDIRRELEA